MRRSDWQFFRAFWLSVVLAIGCAAADTHAQPTPPNQPATGPGGSDYMFNATRVTTFGKGAGSYSIIEPRGRADQPLPVILFVHGLGGTSYTTYEAWIEHLARKGNVVIFLVYHNTGLVDPTTFTKTAGEAAFKALAKCNGVNHKSVDTKRFTMIGHSLGGTIIANLAARPKHFGLPTPQALMLQQPGDTKADQGIGALFPSLTEDHSKISAKTLMLIIDVENDYFVSPKAGQRIYDNASNVKSKNKRRLLLQTDDHGDPAIVADHMLPIGWLNPRNQRVLVNAYDYACWRWFDAMQAVAHGDEAKRALVFGEAAMDLGWWSDGTPVRRPIDPMAE